MEKLFELMLACMTMLMLPVTQRDEKVLQKTFADLKDAMKGFKGDTTTEQYKKLEESVDAINQTLELQGEKLNSLGRGFGGSQPKLVLSASEALDLREAGACFRDADMAKQFGAVVVRGVLGRTEMYKSIVCKEIRGLADEVVKTYQKDLDPDVEGLGGSLIPDIYMPTLISHLESVGNIFPLCTRIPMTTTGTITLPTRTGGMTAYPTDSGAKITESTPTTGKVTLRAVKWAVLTGVPNEFWRNAQLLVQLGQWLGLEITYAMASAWDNALINGDGTADYGNITGILQNSNITSVAAAATHTTIKTAGAKVDGEDISNVIAGQTKGYVFKDNPYWIFNLSVKEKLRALKATDGTPLYLPSDQAEPSTIDGYKYETSPFMPTAASVSAGEKYCIFGSLRLAIYFGLLQALRIDQSTDAGFANDMTYLRGIAEADAEYVDNDAVVTGKTATE